MVKVRQQRVLSVLLVVCMLIGCIPFLTMPAQAIYHADNAPAATADLLAQTGSLFAALPTGGMLRVIDGELYVWGSNEAYSLGLGTDYVYNGKTLNAGDCITSPVKHNYDFKGNIIQIDTDNTGLVTVLTDEGYVYSWGGTHFYDFILSYLTPPGDVSVPYEWDISAVTSAGHHLVGLDAHSPTYISVYDEQGTCYIGGSAKYAASMTGTAAGQILPILDSFTDQFQVSYDKENKTITDNAEKAGGAKRTTITRFYPMHHSASAFIWMSDGRFFAYNGNDYGQNWQPDILNSSGAITGYGGGITEVLEDDQNKNLADANPRLDTIISTGRVTGVIDASGNAWLSGGSNAAANEASFAKTQTPFFPMGTNWRRPQKVFDASMIGSKVQKIFLSEKLAVFLTDDNSLYAIGTNSNQLMGTTIADGTIVTEPTQIFADLSKSQTITGVYVTNSGVMVITKSGEQYYTGDNSMGTAGNGTTDSPPPGQVEEAVPPNLPPVQPLTANKISFEIEESNGTRYYNEQDASGNVVTKKVELDATTGKPKSPVSVTDMKLYAGSIFKLNVYFEDFGKLNSWVVPIRFNPNYLKVVNGNGVAYAENTISTPGAIGKAIGITKEFTNEQWAGGTLIGEGGTSGTYPKICNSDGWLSISGYTSNSKAMIEGKVKMFSVTFTVAETTGTGNLTTFAIATNENVYDFGVTQLKCPNGYDDSAPDAQKNGAAWLVTNTASTSVVQTFDFNYAAENDPFPSFETKIEPLRSITAQITRSDGSGLEMENGVPIEDNTYDGYVVNNSNKSEIYTITIVPTPSNASFPQVDWTVSLRAPKPDGVTAYTDFITIVEEQGTYLKFKLADGIDPSDAAAIQFTATTKRNAYNGQKLSQQVNIVVKSVAGPQEIVIREKASLTAQTMIYTAIDDNTENKTFHADFPSDAGTFSNTAVNWKLLDMEGNELDAADLSNAIYLGAPIAGNGSIGASNYVAPEISVNPNHTTFDEEYVILRVESLYDTSKYDEVKLKVHLKATELKFKQSILRLPTDSSKDLSTLLQIGPENDYYAVDLEWTYIPDNEENPYLITNGTSTVTAGSTPTPSGTPPVYDTIHVRDTISGKEADIQIQVLSLESPIMPNDVTVYNLLGPTSDYITVNKLKEGDIITFYKTYDTPGEGSPGYDANDVRKFGPLTAAQAGTFNFPVQNFLDGGGGEIAMTVTRKAGDSDAREYDRVPVSYDAEPSKVYGYISLAGKASNSARLEGIAVQLSGLSSPDVVYTDSKGYFEFKSYIIPGSYTLTIYQDNYLKRVVKPDSATGYQGIQIPSKAEFAISTADDPIELYPGDLNADGAINATDLNQYVRNWLGKSQATAGDISHYDFYDSATTAISIEDLDLVSRHNGWVRENYPKWNTPAVS